MHIIRENGKWLSYSITRGTVGEERVPQYDDIFVVRTMDLKVGMENLQAAYETLPAGLTFNDGYGLPQNQSMIAEQVWFKQTRIRKEANA